MAYDQDYALPRTGAPTREEERVSAQTLLALIGFGLVTLFVAIPGGNVIYALLGLVLFGFYTIFDFNRLKRASDMRVASALAASIFLDIFNIFLFMLSLPGGGRR